MGIQIRGSVGKGGANSAEDVAAVAEALVAVGVDNGGIFAALLGLDWLGEAVAQFQLVQGLMPNPDGRADPGGSTMRRINAILFPDEVGVRPLADAPSLATSVNANAWTPDEVS